MFFQGWPLEFQCWRQKTIFGRENLRCQENYFDLKQINIIEGLLEL